MTEWADVKIVRDDAERVSKYVFSKPDAVAEAVLYRYPEYRTRTVICCSTQSGCPVGCRFCGAGDHFVRSLTTNEIVAQVVRTLEDADCLPSEMGRLQIMFMSMGEPLLNLKGLIPALYVLYHLYPDAALLISTSAPAIGDNGWRQINEISRAIPTVGLQFSVHESTDAARNELIPFKAKLSLDRIGAQGREWFAETGRHPFFNYCAHDDNTADADADRIVGVFDPRIFCATVSVVCERGEGLKARNEHQRNLAVDFGQKLVDRGFDVRVFDPAGQDTIGGGCGQLWFVQQWMRDHGALARPTAGSGLPMVHAPA
jgi:23S rRNA (adenine2503-C2)-methyltransferase